MKEQDLKILGLKLGATEVEIKKAFRAKARTYHPDINNSNGSNEKFIRICDAYKALLENKYTIYRQPIIVDQTELNKIAKKYNRPLNKEELEQRLQRAKDYAKIKTFKEKNIRTLSYHQIQHSFIKKLHLYITIVCLSLLTFVSLDYLILEPIATEGVLLNRKSEGIYIRNTIYDIEASRLFKNEHPNAKHTGQYLELYSNILDPNNNNVYTNTKVQIYTSRISNDLLGFGNIRHGSTKMIKNQFSIYLMFWAYFILFLFPFIILLIAKPTSAYIVGIYLSTYLGIATCILLFYNLFF